jgi:Subtilase family
MKFIYTLLILFLFILIFGHNRRVLAQSTSIKLSTEDVVRFGKNPNYSLNYIKSPSSASIVSANLYGDLKVSSTLSIPLDVKFSNKVIISSKANFSGSSLPILGGRYRLIFKGDDGSESIPIDIKIYGSDTGPGSKDGISSDEFNFIICPGSQLISIKMIQTALNSVGINDNQLKFKVPGSNSETGISDRITSIPTGKKLEGDNSPCNCTFYTLVTGNTDPKNFSKYLRALSQMNLEPDSSITISPNVIRWLAPHSLYGLGPDKSSYKPGEPVVINALPGVSFIKPVNLVIVDSGVDKIALQNNKVKQPFGSKFINSALDVMKIAGHGTPIAYVASKGDPKVSIYSEIVCDSEGHCPESNIIPAICRYSKKAFIDNKTVINMSFYSPSPSDILDKVMKSMAAKSIYFAAAAGNSDTVTSEGIKIKKALDSKFPLFGFEGMYPAGISASGIFGVGSVDKKSGKLAESSILGPHAKTKACGRWLQSIDPSGNLRNYSGTSFATAVVSGKLLSLLSLGATTISTSALTMDCP